MSGTILIIFVAAVVSISLIGAALEIAFVLNRRRKRQSTFISDASQSAGNEEPGGRRSVAVWIFFLLFGLLFAGIGGGALLFSKAQTEGWVETSAEISSYHYNSSSEQFHIEVSYHFRGRSYEGIPLNYGDSSMSEGQVITILVNPRHPEAISMNLKTMSFLFYIFIAAGSAFFLFGLYHTIRTLRGKSKRITAGL